MFRSRPRNFKRLPPDYDTLYRKKNSIPKWPLLLAVNVLSVQAPWDREAYNHTWSGEQTGSGLNNLWIRRQ